MKLHKKQQEFVNNLVNEVRNSPKNKKPVFISASSSPGSGKTTILIESSIKISNFLTNNMSIRKEGVKEVLVLAFDKKMKDAINKKITKHPNIDEEIFEVSTVHSLFFREIKRFQKLQNANNSFELDYTKGFFTKKMIKYFLDSLSFKTPSLSNKIPIEIDNARLFNDTSISNEKNIEMMWALVNTYYSSPYPMKAIKQIIQDAKFFSKNEINLQELELSDLAIEELEKVNRAYKDDISIYELLFRILIRRIGQLATVKEQNIHIKKKKIEVPVDITDANGNVINTRMDTIEKTEREIETLGNLIKVPHCFYYKSFYNKIIKDKEFAKSVFGNYKVILVDEAQDNDRILFQILVNIAKQGIVKNFAFVGDPLQSIYAFKSPDHFDMLSYMDNNSDRFRQMNIEYHSHALDITFRFNKEIANFVNSLFGSTIEAISDRKSFVYPEEIKNDKLDTLIKNLSGIKDKTVSIICRSNAEAMRLFVELKAKGSDNVVLHSSSKDELKNFVKKGSDAIDNERVKNILLNIINKNEVNPKERFTYSEILSNPEAISYLAQNGHSHLVRFSKNEIDNYIVPANKKRKDVVWIGTAHLFKGAEFDYTIVAGDFFKKPKRVNANEIAATFEQQSNDAKISNTLLNDFFGETAETEKELTIDIREDVQVLTLAEQLNDNSNHEEKCIYYVAFTRAKEGVFICETPYWNELKEHINNGFDAKQEMGYLLEEKKEATLFNEAKAELENSLFSIPQQVVSPA